MVWLFSWPPTPIEFVVSVVLAAVCGWMWGCFFMSWRANRALEAIRRDMQESSARVEKMMNEPVIPGAKVTLAQAVARQRRPT